MRSVAKGNYIKGKGGIKHALSHVRYLQMRGGDDREQCAGRKRLFISAIRDGISGSEVNERLKKQDENGVIIHRIVLSPGIPGVNMDAYTRAVMSELERSKGLDFEYYATEHKNTDHDHTHVVLFGRDQHGRPVTLNRLNYKTVREAGDRYLERHHKYDRYLDKELETLMRDGYKHDRGDRDFESLLKDLSEEWDEERHDLLPEFDREVAFEALPESERIVRDNVIYSQYSSLDDLIELDKNLNNGLLERVSKEEYFKLCSWIGNKKQFGDDYYERTAEEIRMFQQFEDDFRRSLSTNNSPPRSFNQYIFESRGRLLDSHERYAIDMQRLQLQKELATIQQSDSDDQELQQGILDQLEWLDAMMDERMESRKGIPIIPRSEKSESATNSEKSVPSAEPERSSEWFRVENSREGEAESSVAKLIFGNEQAADVSQYEKSEVEQQIELWHKIAFDSNFSRYLGDRTNGHVRNSDQVQPHEDRLLDQIMHLQVQQTLEEQIKAVFQETHSRGQIDSNKEDREHEREDPGREHTR